MNTHELDEGCVAESVVIARIHFVCLEAMPDLIGVRRSRASIILDFPESEFHVRIKSGATTVLVSFFAVFREEGGTGGTWWSDWQCKVPLQSAGPGFSEAIAMQISERRALFADALADRCPVSRDHSTAGGKDRASDGVRVCPHENRRNG